MWVSCLFPSVLAKRVARLSHPMRPARRRRRHWPRCPKYRRGGGMLSSPRTYDNVHPHMRRPTLTRQRVQLATLTLYCSVWNFEEAPGLTCVLQECCSLNDQACEERLTLGWVVERVRQAPNQPLPGVGPVHFLTERWF